MRLSRSVVSSVIIVMAVAAVGTFLPRLTSLLSPDAVSIDYHHLLLQTVREIHAEDQLKDGDDELQEANTYLKRPQRNKGKTLVKSNKIPQISDNDRPKRMVRVFPTEQVPEYRFHAIARSSGLDQNLKETSGNLAAHRLQRLLTQPTTSCRRLVRVGGRSCLGVYDGAKLVCMDEDVKLRPLDCLLYSFGVGNDFTFDEHMQDFGCEVHAFDHDNDHEVYDYRLGPTAFFHKSRIGSQTGYFRICEETPNGHICEPALRYQTMADIRKNLGHEDQRLDYLKMDVEGGEWQVLPQVLHNTSVLSTVSQVTLEVSPFYIFVGMFFLQHIHLEELRSKKTLAGKREAVALYIDVIQSLRNVGFQLVRHDENGLNPQYETIDGVRLSLYAELLFIRRNHAIEIV